MSVKIVTDSVVDLPVQVINELGIAVEGAACPADAELLIERLSVKFPKERIISVEDNPGNRCTYRTWFPTGGGTG